MPGWIDSHAHLVSEPLLEKFETLKKNAVEHGVEKVCIICGNLKEIETALERIESDPFFDIAIGVHPGSVQDIDEEEFEKMMQYLDSPRVKFVGEIGLDYYWDTTYADLQMTYFKRQIALANKKQLPITVHMRNATEAVYEALRSNPVDKKGIIHCFTESVAYAEKFSKLGYTLGVGGVVTFKNGQNVRDILNAVPLSQIITETDSPYLTPVPYRGKENQPAYVSYVGKCIAAELEMDEEKLQKILWDNYTNITR